MMHSQGFFIVTTGDPEYSIDALIQSLSSLDPSPRCQIFQEDAQPYVDKIQNANNIFYVFDQLHEILTRNKKYPNIAILREIFQKCIELNEIKYATAIYGIAVKSAVVDIGMHLNMMDAAAKHKKFLMIQVACQNALKENITTPSYYHTMINCLMKLRTVCEIDPDPKNKLNQRNSDWLFDAACAIYKKSGIQPIIALNKDGTYKSIDFHGFHEFSTLVGLYVLLQTEQEKIEVLKKEDTEHSNEKKLFIRDVIFIHGIGMYAVKSGICAFLEDPNLKRMYEMRYTANNPNEGCIFCHYIEERLEPLPPQNIPNPYQQNNTANHQMAPPSQQSANPYQYPAYLNQRPIDPNQYPAYPTHLIQPPAYGPGITYSYRSNYPNYFDQQPTYNAPRRATQHNQGNKMDPNAPDFSPCYK